MENLHQRTGITRNQLWIKKNQIQGPEGMMVASLKPSSRTLVSSTTQQAVISSQPAFLREYLWLQGRMGGGGRGKKGLFCEGGEGGSVIPETYYHFKYNILQQ